MSRKGSRGSASSVGSVGSVDSFQSTSSPDAFEEEEEDTNNIKTPAAALRRGSVAKMEPGLRGLRMSFKTEENQYVDIRSSYTTIGCSCFDSRCRDQCKDTNLDYRNQCMHVFSLGICCGQ